MATLLEAGLSLGEIARRLERSKPTISYHARRLGHVGDERFRRRYDWGEVQRCYDAGHSVTDCQRRFGFARSTWSDAVARGVVRPRSQALPIAVLLPRARNRRHLAARLVAAGMKEARCEICGLLEWRGAPLVLPLHHVNGDGIDNRLANLQLLCPNCHSQTPNFAGRNRGRRSGARAGSQGATGVAKRPALPRASMGEAHAETQLRPHSH
ncbi:MAG TPA: helix-turn-helix domain-containing protein [Solirubrobacteraceae bacterium]|nr:helix-turn-helix domain-containing protein [Solirubrobacteraceae bacterium]